MLHYRYTMFLMLAIWLVTFDVEPLVFFRRVTFQRLLKRLFVLVPLPIGVEQEHSENTVTAFIAIADKANIYFVIHLL